MWANLLFRGLRLVRRLIGRPFREWSAWAAKEPGAAAVQLDAISTVLAARSKAYRRQDGWRARRDRELAKALRDQAEDMRDAAERPNPRELKDICSVAPGTYGRA